MLAGSIYELRFDVIAMSDVEQQLELMKLGTTKKSFYQLLDSPYDVREVIVMLLAGINGAKRVKGDTSFLDLKDVQALLNMHFDYIGSQADNDLAKFQDLQGKMWAAISEAARAGMGFRKRPLMEPPDQGPPQQVNQ